MNQLPKIRIDSVRRLVDDGNHNGFTDLCRYKGMMYLAYRCSPTSHLVPTQADSTIVILQSRDGRDWKEAFRSQVIPCRDVRDPHLLVFKDRLFVYSGSWIIDPATGGHDLSQHIGHVVWTDDGDTWHGPQEMPTTYGHYIWRCASHGGMAFLVGRRVALADFGGAIAMVESIMLGSDDGFTWRPIARFQETAGNEVAFLFEEDGQVVALARQKGEAQVCRARPPYREWTRTGIGRIIGGPMIAKWGSHYLVGGRRVHPPGNPKTVLSWLVDDKLVDMAELPSGGDNAYTGFIPLSDTRGLVSYYSSHEGSGTREAPCHVYLAEVSLDHA